MSAKLKHAVEIESDVLIIGGGFAGMEAAIAAREAGQEVVLVDKAVVARSGCSSFMAGVILICTPEDDKDVWFKEMVVGGEFLNDQEWVKTFLEESYHRAVEAAEWAQKYGKQIFEREANGAFVRKKARGHIETACTVVQARPFVDTLKRRARELGARVVERVMVNDLLVANGKVGGAFGFNYRTGESYFFKAKAVIVAAGATNYRGLYMAGKNITGDGVAAAFRTGAILQNMELFLSNTCAADYDTHGMNLMVSIGGEFVNGLGEKFMKRYNPTLGSRSPLSNLALAFSREVMEGRGPIYLDVTAATPEDRELCRKILPETFKIWDQVGFSPLDKPVKWVPVPRGHVGNGGGIGITLNCETNIPGLFAAGDAAWKALNGSGGGPNGKAAGFAIVSGHRAGRFSAEYARQQEVVPSQPELIDAFQAAQQSFIQPILRPSGIDPDSVVREIQNLLFKCEVYFIKSEARVQNTIDQLVRIKTEMLPEMSAQDPHDLMKANETKNMLVVAEALFRSAQVRKESRGSHFLEEYPQTNNRDWLKHTLLQKDGEGMKRWTVDVPTPYLRPTEDFAISAGTRRE